MALTANTVGLDKAALVDLVGNEETVERYSNRDDDNIVKALNAATDAFRSAAIKGGYSAESVDALTGSTCPEGVKRWILHWSLDELTSGGIGRPESIGKYGDEARKWLSRLAGAAETIDGLTRVAAGGTSVDYRAPSERKFDRNNVSQKYNLHDPELT